MTQVSIQRAKSRLQITDLEGDMLPIRARLLINWGLNVPLNSLRQTTWSVDGLVLSQHGTMILPRSLVVRGCHACKLKLFSVAFKQCGVSW
jgi:hypothetical protein